MNKYTSDSLRVLINQVANEGMELRREFDAHADAWDRHIKRMDAAELDRHELLKDNAALREQYNQLIHAVETKHEGESRHETALRYIREAEYEGGDVAAIASQPEVKP